MALKGEMINLLSSPTEPSFSFFRSFVCCDFRKIQLCGFLKKFVDDGGILWVKPYWRSKLQLISRYGTVRKFVLDVHAGEYRIILGLQFRNIDILKITLIALITGPITKIVAKTNIVVTISNTRPGKKPSPSILFKNTCLTQTSEQRITSLRMLGNQIKMNNK